MATETDVVAQLEASDSRTVYVATTLDGRTRVKLALEHDVHSTWDTVRGVWAFSRGVPEDVVNTYHALSDGPEISKDAVYPYPERPLGEAEPMNPAPTSTVDHSPQFEPLPFRDAALAETHEPS